MLNDSDAAIITRDPAIPGLRLLFDGAELASVLSENPQFAGIVGARATYLRYKPGISCLARIEVRSPAAKTIAYAVAYRQDAVDKWQKVSDCPGEQGAAEPISLKNYSTVLFPFPLDRRLPSLAHLGDLAALRSLLDRIAPGVEPWNKIQVSTLRYKPERRYVGRLTIDERPIAVLKLHAAKGYRKARRAAKTFNSLPEVRLARCIGHSDRHSVIVTEWVDGVSLSTAIGDASRAADARRYTAQALRHLHSQQATKLPANPPAAVAKHLRKHVRHLAFVTGDLGNRIRTLYKEISRRLLKTGTPNLVPSHGDLHLDQILVLDQGVCLLDFDRACLAEIAYDLGTMYADVLRREGDGAPHGGAGRFLEDLLSDYQLTKSPIDRRRVRLNAACRLLEFSGEPFRHRRSDWLCETSRLITLAEQVLLDGSDQEARRNKDQDEATKNGRGKLNEAGIDGDRKGVRIQGSGVRENATAASPAGLFLTAVVEDPYHVAADAQLPSARQALDPAFARALRDLASDDGEHSGLEVTDIRVLCHKPGRRSVIEYAGRSTTTGEPLSLIGKIQAKPRHRRHFELQRHLWLSGFDSSAPDGISVARPWAVVPELSLWLQEKSPGKDGWTGLQTERGCFVAMRIAQAIAKLHNTVREPLRSHTIHDEMSMLEDRLQQAASLLPDLECRVWNLLDSCHSIAQQMPPSEAVPIHRDFYPDHVLIDGERLMLIDFDLVAWGAGALDVGNFRGHLTEYSLRRFGHPSAFCRQEAALLREYGRLQPTVSRESIDAYTILTLARHVFLCATLPGRADNAARTLRICERAIAKWRSEHLQFADGRSQPRRPQPATVFNPCSALT